MQRVFSGVLALAQLLVIPLGLASSGAVIFEQSLGEDRLLTLFRSTHSEFRDQPQGDAPENLPEGTKLLVGEYLTEDYVLRVRVKKGDAVTLWSKSVTYPAILEPEEVQKLKVWDAAVSNSALYVFYSYQGVPTLDRLSQISARDWILESETQFEQHRDIQDAEILLDQEGLRVNVTLYSGQQQQWAVQ